MKDLNIRTGSNGENFAFAGERFADLQMLRYRLNGFESLTLQQKR
jgi:dipeptidyl-peptidase-3